MPAAKLGSFRRLAAVLIALLILCGCSQPAAGDVQSSRPKRSFEDDFARQGMLKEAGSMEESTDPNWWVNSGAYLYFNGKVARTIQGELPENDPRRLIYLKENPAETDNGFHPQNIFRLVTRSKWQNYSQQAYYKINHYILSKDEHRQASNGLLLFNHYLDGQNLYYTGLRVDGYAVIKKKINSNYYTLIDKKILPGKYDRDSAPDLIPTGQWIGVRTDVATLPDNSVHIQLFLDLNNSGQWNPALEFTDNSNHYGGPPISDAGYAGIRTDFMDVEFSSYAIVER